MTKGHGAHPRKCRDLPKHQNSEQDPKLALIGYLWAERPRLRRRLLGGKRVGGRGLRPTAGRLAAVLDQPELARVKLGFGLLLQPR